MRHSVIYLLIAAFICPLFAAPAVSTVVSTNRVVPNEAFTYQIQLALPVNSAAPNITAPALPADFAFTATPFRSSSSTTRNYSIVNGVMTDNSALNITLFCQLVPKRTGELQIPPLTFTVNGERCTTEAVTVIVEEQHSGNAGSGGEFIQHLSSEHGVLGQPVILTYILRVPNSLDVHSWAPMLPLAELQELFTLPANLDLNNDWKQRQRTINGIPTRELSIDIQLLPKRDGILAIPAASAGVTIFDNSSRRSNRRRDPFGFFDDPFFGGRVATKELLFTTDELSLDIQPLPAEGKPADFSGIIGPLTAEAAAEPTEISVGDPIILTITLRGPAALSEVRLPDLKQQPELIQNFKISGDDPGTIEGDAIVFQRTLRAIRPGQLTLPALFLPYFDPETGQYTYAETAEIPLSVAAARQITINDALATTPLSAAAESSPLPESAIHAAAQSGLTPNHPAGELLRSQSAPNYLTRKALLGILIPPALWIILALIKLVTAITRSTPEERAQRSAKKLFLQAVKHARSAAEINTAQQAFWTARLALPPGVVTWRDIETRAPQAGIAPEALAPLRQLFEDAEAAQYAGKVIDLPSFRKQFTAALKGF